jgi:hypothetical protein
MASHEEPKGSFLYRRNVFVGCQALGKLGVMGGGFFVSVMASLPSHPATRTRKRE